MTDRAPAHMTFDWKDLGADLDRLLCWADGHGASFVDFGPRWCFGEKTNGVNVEFGYGTRCHRLVSGRPVPEDAVEALALRCGVQRRADRTWSGYKVIQISEDDWYDAVRADAASPEIGDIVRYAARHGGRASRWRVLFRASSTLRRVWTVSLRNLRSEAAPPGEAADA